MQNTIFSEIREASHIVQSDISKFLLRNIIIVDDDAINLEVARRALTPQYKVRMYKSGIQLLEALKNFIPDLIFLDVVMPDMDGYETIVHLKRNKKTKHIPVIFLSSNDDSVSEQKAMELGAFDYLHKPYSSHMLRRYLRLAQCLKIQANEIDMYNRNCVCKRNGICYVT